MVFDLLSIFSGVAVRFAMAKFTRTVASRASVGTPVTVFVAIRACAFSVFLGRPIRASTVPIISLGWSVLLGVLAVRSLASVAFEAVRRDTSVGVARRTASLRSLVRFVENPFIVVCRLVRVPLRCS